MDEAERQGMETKVSLMDIALVLARRKRVWLGCALGFTLVAAVYTLIVPVTYTAEADILPPQQSSSATSMLMGQMSSMLGMSGGGAGMKDQNDLVLAILKSRAIADGLIRQFDLKHVFHVSDETLLERALAGRSKIESTPEGLISIKVTDHDPKLAAALANGYVDQLHNENEHLALTEAGQRRLFFARQLADEKNALADAEVALKETQVKTGVISLQGQTELSLSSEENLRAQLASDRVQLQALLTSETANNPDVVRLQEQIAALDTEVRRIQNGKPAKGSSSDRLPTSAVPEASLDYIRKQREVKYHETLFDLLARQFEAAKIDESKEAPAIQVIDNATPPHFKSGPKRTLITVASGAIGLFFGVIWSILAEISERELSDSEKSRQWSALKRAIRRI
ncbi:MAG TPA: Wzz/FepE/Etk N-terminal domain-containing protein [Granulicella sp.]|nr:Wzz/FepE/Etk N-terminal domain-containing protein [Granulicella sp.]